MPIFLSFSRGEKLVFVLYTEGANQYVEKAEGMGYGRQWFGHHDVLRPEIATVGVQVSWRGATSGFGNVRGEGEGS